MFSKSGHFSMAVWPLVRISVAWSSVNAMMAAGSKCLMVGISFSCMIHLNKTVNEGDSLSFILSSIDLDGDSLIYTTSTIFPSGSTAELPEEATLTSDSLFTWVPDLDIVSKIINEQKMKTKNHLSPIPHRDFLCTILHSTISILQDLIFFARTNKFVHATQFYCLVKLALMPPRQLPPSCDG